MVVTADPPNTKILTVGITQLLPVSSNRRNRATPITIIKIPKVIVNISILYCLNLVEGSDFLYNGLDLFRIIVVISF
jgi:hypothetical protein